MLENGKKANNKTLQKIFYSYLTPVYSRFYPLGTIETAYRELMSLRTLYEAAMQEAETKLGILEHEFQAQCGHNPIHHIESRLKSPFSIIQKMQKRGLTWSIDNATAHITDIAGLRVICPCLGDIYYLAGLLTSQEDVQLIRQSDYILKPKENGYRSLHLIVNIKVSLSKRTEYVPVEIQLRTLAMDLWASLEHELNYKADQQLAKSQLTQLKSCAEDLADIDCRLQSIYSDYRELWREPSKEYL